MHECIVNINVYIICMWVYPAWSLSNCLYRWISASFKYKKLWDTFLPPFSQPILSLHFWDVCHLWFCILDSFPLNNCCCSSFLFVQFLRIVLLMVFHKCPWENPVCSEQAVSQVKSRQALVWEFPGTVTWSLCPADEALGWLLPPGLPPS